MIGWLFGEVLEILEANEVLFKVGDIAYRVVLLTRDINKLLSEKNSCGIYVFTKVREDSITLYGFLVKKDLRIFEKLVTTHGVGPSLGNAILERFDADEVKTIIESQDIEKLTLVPGIGKKTATRILLELKPQFELNKKVADPKLQQVRDTLLSLGYSYDEIHDVILSLNVDDSPEELIKQALKTIARQNKASSKFLNR